MLAELAQQLQHNFYKDLFWIKHHGHIFILVVKPTAMILQVTFLICLWFNIILQSYAQLMFIRFLLIKDQNWSLYIQWKNWKIIGKMRVIMVYNVVVENGFPFNRSNNTNKAHTTFCVQPPRWELLWWRRFDWNVDILFVNVRIGSYRLSFYPDIVSLIRTFHVLSF